VKRWLARVLTRDVISFVGGWFIILYQMLEVPPTQVNEWFLLLGGSLIGVPGIAEIIALRGKKLTDGQSSTVPVQDSSAQQ
jgi:hypothetical protein